MNTPNVEATPMSPSSPLALLGGFSNTRNKP
jgi:hypothetical protein